jgi:hypothetical protein
VLNFISYAKGRLWIDDVWEPGGDPSICTCAVESCSRMDKIAWGLHDLYALQYHAHEMEVGKMGRTFSIQ